MGLSSTTISDDRPFAGSILREMRTHTVRLFYYCGNRIPACSSFSYFLVERSACFFYFGVFCSIFLWLSVKGRGANMNESNS